MIYIRDTNKVVFMFESGVDGVASGLSGNWFGLVTSHNPTENENIQTIRYAGTSTRNFGQLVVGPQDYEGTITYYAQNWKMLGYTLGSMVDVSGTVNQHRLSEINSDTAWYATTSGVAGFPTFTIKDSKKGLADGQHMVRTFGGAIIDKFSLSAKQGEPVVCEVSYKAQRFTLGSKTTDIVSTYDEDTSRPYIWSDVTFAIPSGTATTIKQINDIKLDINNNVEVRHYVNGSRAAQAFVPTMRDYTIDLTLDANSEWGAILESYHKTGSSFNSQLQLVQTGSEYINLMFSGCKIFTFAAPSEIEGIDNFKVTIKPLNLYAAGSGYCRLYNPW